MYKFMKKLPKLLKGESKIQRKLGRIGFGSILEKSGLKKAEK